MSDCIDKGYVSFNYDNYYDDNNFFVTDPDKVLSLLTGKKWIIHKEYNVNYNLTIKEYAIEYWSYNDGKTGHFARTAKGFNSLQYSKSVETGKIVSLRICKVVE